MKTQYYERVITLNLTLFLLEHLGVLIFRISAAKVYEASKKTGTFRVDVGDKEGKTNGVMGHEGGVGLPSQSRGPKLRGPGRSNGVYGRRLQANEIEG